MIVCSWCVPPDHIGAFQVNTLFWHVTACVPREHMFVFQVKACDFLIKHMCDPVKVLSKGA